ncbi:dihydrodipicolinate synthase family protein [Amaricoccus sp. W119]|uniref:dihydrodipicolinate synthase family protein n=1 Tax=Amaricoccus sp. W119 TaxID=3391833 RepID=UPI0039A526A6
MPMTAFPFSGLNLAVTTPFDAEGRVDLDRLDAHLERYIEAGVDGFVLSSGTGMHVYLTREESDALVSRGAKAIAGRAKLIVQTSALLLDDVLARTRHAADHGADGVMVLPPFFEGPADDEGLLAFYADVAAAGLPVIGYNVPQAVGVGISPALLAELCRLPNFVTVKDSGGDLPRQAALIRTGLPVMNGADPLTPHALFAGAAGVIWGGANFAPRACAALVRAATERRWEDVREIWRLLEPAMNLIWEGDYVASVYAAAEITGYGAGQPRRPLRPLDAGKLEVLRSALGDLAAREAAWP